ncbi:hypothetical protein RIF29_42230 [Crotalaria pallida]|uniref:Uncharacterized protein n=1 Tax=Crotalaria pallida TaxID=3830 RepID=A0AAN9HS80_CROPI
MFELKGDHVTPTKAIFSPPFPAMSTVAVHDVSPVSISIPGAPILMVSPIGSSLPALAVHANKCKHVNRSCVRKRLFYV